MPTCAVPICKSGYTSHMKLLKIRGLPSPAFFTAPNEAILERWNRNVKRGDRKLTLKDRVCSLHFRPEDIERTYRTVLPDGTVEVIERGKAKLRDGAIPRRFYRYRDNFNKPTKRTKSTKRSVVPAKKESQRCVPVEFVSLPDCDTPSSTDNSDIDLKPTLPLRGVSADTPWSLDDIPKVRMPTKAWNYHHLPTFVTIAHINDNLVMDKTVSWHSTTPVISPIIKLNEVVWESGKVVRTVSDVEELLKIVDGLRVCCGTSTFCEGATKNSLHARCNACLTERKRLKKID